MRILDIEMPQRCDWSEINETMAKYHDNEWGIPLHNDQKLFEFLILDGFQAGLSWNIVLNKRDHFRQAFYDYDLEKITNASSNYVSELLQNSNIIKNRSKIQSVFTNAAEFLKIQGEFGSFDHFIWRFVDWKPIQNSWESIDQIPTTSKLSEQISFDLRKRGFKFIGPTICYAYMQSIGMVNDHLKYCFRNEEIKIKYPK
jgi:DNA-3-methyladenine glycosylase I